ncbi:MAG: AAA family ATPase [Micrococcales bacterium]
MPEQIAKSDLLDAASRAVLDLIDEGVRTPVILIDGRSGSGKTTFSAEFQNRLFRDGESAPRVIHMDDLYDGWHGLQAGHDYLVRHVLTPTARRTRASWQEYDWELGRREAWREFEGGTPLIIEGCGSLSPVTLEFANLAIWLDADEKVRQQRWVARSGHDHDEWWPVWAAQELEFYAKNNSRDLATWTVENGG